MTKIGEFDKKWMVPVPVVATEQRLVSSFYHITHSSRCAYNVSLVLSLLLYLAAIMFSHFVHDSEITTIVHLLTSNYD